MICRPGTHANPAVGIIAAGLNLFGRRRGHFCHLQSAFPVHSARIMIETDRSIVRRVRVRYRKGSEGYTEVWGIWPGPWRAAASMPLLLLRSRASSNFGSGNCVHRPRRGTIQLPIFPQKCSSLLPERAGPLRNGASCRPRLITLSGTSKENE